jgi:type III restriction enzyme
MTRVFLQDMVDDLQFDSLPVNWTAFDLATFSTKKRLWDYQQKAVESAIKVLWKYYDDFVDYQLGERLEGNQERKRRFSEWYRVNGQDANLDIGLKRANRNISHLLTEYYEVEDGKVSYEHFINRMSFWMATGSGKSLVLVKLIEVLRDLIQLGEVPPHDILVLTYRDDLIDQLRVHVNEFNAARSDIFIRLRELKEYADAKREHPSLFKEQELTVFYYRSDNLSDEQKEKIIDFKNYDDQGKWYVLLDEAHKGDREESKRQHIYSILSRNGFLFNFSATFTDSRDLITTVSNFNLSEFIRAGYGKHIAILRQEIRAFRDDEDYSNEEKQKVVLKSLMMLAYVSKFYEDIRSVKTDSYHKPLLLTLVHSVNTEEADLKLFFRELERIGRGAISDDVWQQAKDELWEEFKERPSLIFEEGSRIETEQQVFEGLSKGDILEHVYNSSSSGEIEILVRPSNRHELVFKLKTSDRPFALIKIGDISGWLKEELAGYEVNERFEDESYFERLNEDDSEIHILMGSRSFYEGWDSNRPNVINFINIGTGTDAKKFILQSVGRGVRIEPLRDKRKRLLQLYNAKEVEEDLFRQIKDKVLPLETLFIFGTNRHALHTVIGQLDQEREDYKQLSLFDISEEARKHKLLIPTYKEADYTLVGQRSLAKFETTESELDLLKRYVEFIHDDRVLLALYNTVPEKIRILKRSLSEEEDYYKHPGKSFKNIDLLVGRIFDYFGIIPERFERLKELEEEIRHFKNIKVSLKDISDLQNRVEKVKNYPTLLKELRAQYGIISAEQYVQKAKSLSGSEQFDEGGKRIRIKYVANHYYIPIILSEAEKVDYIKHIIKTPSEVEFVNDLERYLQGEGNKFKEFDWWLFSRLDESLDQVYIPYYDPKTNRIRHFYPDFIFWLQKGDGYFIVFIDPKGTSHTDYMHKVAGYRMIFEEDGSGRRVLDHEGLKARVFTFLYTDDVNMLSQGYRKYWSDNIGKVLTSILNDPRSEQVTYVA